MFGRRFLWVAVATCAAAMMEIGEPIRAASGPGCWGFGRHCFVSRGGPVRNLLARIHYRWQVWRWGCCGCGFGGYCYGCFPYSPCVSYYSVDPCWYGQIGPIGLPSRVLYSNSNLYVDSLSSVVRYLPNTSKGVDVYRSSMSRRDPIIAPTISDEPVVRGDEILLDLAVPADAIVTINGHPTKSKGTSRRYVARRLNPVREYSFHVQAVIYRDGQTLQHVTLVTSRSGQRQRVSMEELAFKSMNPTTTLVIHLPPEAQLKLAGTNTNQSGERRTFTTTALRAGEEWRDYLIVAEVERDGELIREERTLTLTAGGTHELTIDFPFPSTRVAVR